MCALLPYILVSKFVWHDCFVWLISPSLRWLFIYNLRYISWESIQKFSVYIIFSFSSWIKSLRIFLWDLCSICAVLVHQLGLLHIIFMEFVSYYELFPVYLNVLYLKTNILFLTEIQGSISLAFEILMSIVWKEKDAFDSCNETVI